MDGWINYQVSVYFYYSTILLIIFPYLSNFSIFPNVRLLFFFRYLIICLFRFITSVETNSLFLLFVDDFDVDVDGDGLVWFRIWWEFFVLLKTIFHHIRIESCWKMNSIHSYSFIFLNFSQFKESLYKVVKFNATKHFVKKLGKNLMSISQS